MANYLEISFQFPDNKLFEIKPVIGSNGFKAIPQDVIPLF
jgi:hypothetical protein